MLGQKQGECELVVWAYFKDLKWWPAVVISRDQIDPRDLDSKDSVNVRFLGVYSK